jgi:hypothetical protein
MKATLLFLFLLGSSACVWSQQVKSADSPLPPPAEENKTYTYKGDYRSLRGVMNPFSCHCFDGGILTTSTGKEIKVCFEGRELDKYMDGNEKACTKLQVTGKMVNHVSNPGKGDVCSGDVVRYLKVKTFKCLN